MNAGAEPLAPVGLWKPQARFRSVYRSIAAFHLQRQEATEGKDEQQFTATASRRPLAGERSLVGCSKKAAGGSQLQYSRTPVVAINRNIVGPKKKYSSQYGLLSAILRDHQFLFDGAGMLATSTRTMVRVKVARLVAMDSGIKFDGGIDPMPPCSAGGLRDTLFGASPILHRKAP